jgi:hypothetical protein
MSRADWVTVTPAAGRLAETAAELLALARHPGDVRTAGSGAEFIVPPYLAEAYMPSVQTEQPKRPARRSKKEVETDGD